MTVLRESQVARILFFFLVVGIFILPLALHIQDVPFHPKAQFTDILVSHWPNTFFLRNSIQSGGIFPLWNPQILSGAPLIADPLFGVWYLPNWLALLLPILTSFNLLFWIHLAWGGIGMYKLMRMEGVSTGGAIVAGLAFCGMPKLVGHIGLGHLGLVLAVTWSPWVLLIVRKAIENYSGSRLEILRRGALAGSTLGLIFLIDPRWFIPLAGLALIYALRILNQVHAKLNVRILGLGIIGSVFTLGITTGLALPLIEFTMLSTRAEVTVGEASSLSIPFQNLIGFLIPNYGGWPETLTYSGLAVLGLGLAAIAVNKRGWVFWTSIAIVMILIAVGTQLPLYKLIATLIPPIRLVRVPARFLFLCFLALGALAGLGYDALLLNSHAQSVRRRMRLAVVGFCGLVFLLGTGGLAITRTFEDPSIGPWIHMIALAVILVILVVISERLERPALIAGLWLALVIADLVVMNLTLLEARPHEDSFSNQYDINEEFQSAYGYERIFSPSYSIGQHIASKEGFELAEGVNPIQLQKYWDFMALAVGFPADEYSVTLPPFPEGEPSSTKYYQLDSQALGLLNVRYLLAAYPITSSGLDNLGKKGDKYLYENQHFRPRAWMEVQGGDGGGSWREVESIDWSPNQIHIETDGEGILVLSEIDYPGWQALDNGIRVPIERYDDFLRALKLGPGSHEVEFRYRPWTVFVGAGITLLTFVAMCVLWIRK
ncbi:MAG: hypothetical protein GTO18_11690 [Anaerolineales bacterium]|nr:hypothetical protein [Anaerolineales bacterium]